MASANMPKQAGSATMAVSFITLGALMSVWAAVYYFFDRQNGSSSNAPFWCLGFFLSGMVLVIVGVLVGRIGRSARAAEVAPMPSVQVVPPSPEAAQLAAAAAAAPVVAPRVPVAPGVATPEVPVATPTTASIYST